MKTERLHTLLRHIIEVDSKHNFVSLLQKYVGVYTASVQTPNPQNAKSLDDADQAIITAANEFPIRGLSPSRYKILESIDGAIYYGEGLKNKIDEIIENSKTPSNAVAQIQELFTKAKIFFPTVRALDDNLNKLGVGFEDTPEESAEVEVIIPESMVEGHLNVLVKEARYLERAFADIREVVTGNRTPIDVRGLDSGSMEIYLTVDLVTGAAILYFITAVVSLINSILQTRNNRESLREQKAPDKIIKDIKRWEGKRIKDHIEQLRDELLNKYEGDEPRKNELKNALSMSLKHLANRIDRGMDIDVTTAATADKTEEEGATGEVKQSINYIHTDTNVIRQLQRTDEPVLQLPIGEEDNNT